MFKQDYASNCKSCKEPACFIPTMKTTAEFHYVCIFTIQPYGKGYISRLNYGPKPMHPATRQGLLLLEPSVRFQS